MQRPHVDPLRVLLRGAQEHTTKQGSPVALNPDTHERVEQDLQPTDSEEWDATDACPLLIDQHCSRIFDYVTTVHESTLQDEPSWSTYRTSDDTSIVLNAFR